METRGFAGYSPAQRKAVSAKGGRAKVPKGLSMIPQERRKEIARLGGLKRSENIKISKESYEKEENPISDRD